MKGIISFLIIVAALWITGCVSADEEELAQDVPAEQSAGESDTVAPTEQVSGETSESLGEEALENELVEQNKNEQNSTPKEDKVEEEFAETELEAPPAADETNATQEEVPPPAVSEAPVQETLPAPVETATPSVSRGQKVRLTNIQFKANDNGGTVVIDATGPVEYTTRYKKETKQFIIEMSNASLPRSLQRPFNTRDFDSVFASIDAYADSKTNGTKIVAQMRNTEEAPVVRTEGSTLMMIASEKSSPVYNASVPEEGVTGGASSSGPVGVETSVGSGSLSENNIGVKQVLSSTSLQQYLSGTTRYYGNKISIQTNEMDVTEALKFISEESGINMVIDEAVKGNLSLKLKDVPWDQALVIILRAKKLGYTRQGNIIRIAPLADLKAEEEDLGKLIAAQKQTEPLKVRMIPISYSDLTELVTQVKPFLSARGQVVADKRSGSIIITDIEEGLNKALKLIANLDSPPPQVLIEGKIVTAVESAIKSFGINWGAGGLPSTQSPSGKVAFTPSFSADGTKGIDFSLNVGTFKILGDLNASFSLLENNNMAKVISSPRVLTLQNEPATISSSSKQPYTTAQVGADGKSSNQINFQSFDMNLNVTPQITNDGSVLLKLDFSREVPIINAASADGASSSQKNTAQTKVLVRNGDTAVIGGIYEFSNQDSEAGVPYLKDIPVLGYLFKGINKQKTKSELLVFVTPRILNNRSGANIEKAGDF